MIIRAQLCAWILSVLVTGYCLSITGSGTDQHRDRLRAGYRSGLAGTRRQDNSTSAPPSLSASASSSSVFSSNSILSSVPTSSASSPSTTPSAQPKQSSPLVWEATISSWTLGFIFGSQGNQTFRMRIDTATSNFSVIASDCVENCATMPKYHTNDTASSNDTVFLASSRELVVQRPIKTLSIVPEELRGGSASGETGFSACPESSSILKDSVFHDATTGSQKFGANLDMKSPAICLGCEDDTFYDSTLPIEYSPLRPDRENMDNWQTSNVSVWVNGRDHVFSDLDVIIDATLPVIYAPLSSVEKLYKNITGAKAIRHSVTSDLYYSLPCENLPILAFQWGNSSTDWSIPAASFNTSNVNSTTCVGVLVAPANNITLQHGHDGPDIWILGQPFLTNVYSIFDLTEQRLGIAHKISQ